MQIILWLLLGYLLYRFVTGFVLPVARTALRMKRQFNEMNQQASQFHSSTKETSESNTYFSGNDGKERSTSGKKGSNEDYIDFEELPKKQS